MPHAAPVLFEVMSAECLAWDPADSSAGMPRVWRRGSFGDVTAPPAAPSGPIVIEGARVLRLDGQVLIFEFEVPADGFLLPRDGTEVGVSFEGEGSCSARVLGQESSKPGPHSAGLVVRLALRLEGQLRWNQRSARITWRRQTRRFGRRTGSGDVELHLSLEASR